MPGSGTAPDHSSALLPADPLALAPAADPVAPGAAPVPGAAPAAGGPRPMVPGWLPAAVSGLVGLVSGLYRLPVPSLWRDEAATIGAAGRSVPQIFALLHHVDAVNGAYYLFMHPVVLALGTSAAAVRLPSVAAMAVAAAFTAALGRRLAELAGLPAPALTGLLAGLLFTAAPEVTRYAQEARAYGLVTMLATAATYLLVRALADDRRRWWAGYGTVIILAGLFNAFSLLLLLAHGLSLLLARARAAAGPPAPAPAAAVSPRQLARWGTAAATATVALAPLLAAGYLQRAQISWVARPRVGTIGTLVTGFAGSSALVLPLTVMAACGIAAGTIPRRERALTPGLIAVPWLAAPAVVLLAVSQVHPVFNPRYVLYSQPALALLGAAGLSWIAGRAAGISVTGLARPLAWLPPALITLIIIVMLAGPQQAVRRASLAGNDNLRRVSAILAAHERSGDAVLYLPGERRIASMAYPGAFRRLNDVALGTSPLASATLAGAEVSPATLVSRFSQVRRVWLVALGSHGHLPGPVSGLDREKVALVGRMWLVRRWRAGTMIVCLFRRLQP